MTQRTAPGKVLSIDGIVFQSAVENPVSVLLVGPLVAFCLRMLGRWVGDDVPRVPLASHVGIGVRLVLPRGDIQRYVVENRSDAAGAGLDVGVQWTVLSRFRKRDLGGWHVAVPVLAFANLRHGDVEAAVLRLNGLESDRAFVTATCTDFVEHVFGREMFAHPWILEPLSPFGGYQISEPSVPLLQDHVQLDLAARLLLRVDALQAAAEALEQARCFEEDGDPVRARSALRRAGRELHRLPINIGAGAVWLLLWLARSSLHERRPTRSTDF